MDSANLPVFVALGASGGEGLSDIKNLLRALGPAPGLVVMVVLHRPSDKLSALREVLASSCAMPVIVPDEAERFEAGTCYIGEPDQHLTLVARNTAGLVPGGGNRLRNRTIDTLFISLAEHARARTIGVVLSGSLDDGSRGLAAIHKARGLTMVLDPGLKPRGMQQNAIDYDGPISFIGTAYEIAATIVQAVSKPHGGKDRAPADLARLEDEATAGPWSKAPIPSDGLVKEG